MSEKQIPSLEYIKQNTLYVTETFDGSNITGSYEELVPRADDAIMPATYTHQPKDLQDFYKAQQKAYRMTYDTSLLNVDSFYEKWAKDPHQFDPAKRKPIGKLHSFLNKIYDTNHGDQNTNVIVNNYDNGTMGNHTLKCFVSALSEIGPRYDFDVVEYTPHDPDNPYSYDTITVQEDDDKKVEDYGKNANDQAIHNSPYFSRGDKAKTPVPAYEMETDDHGKTKARGIMNIDGRAVPVAISSTYGGHTFTKDEMDSLISGKETDILGFKTKAGNVVDIKGKITKQSYMGNTYYGFERTDLQKQRTRNGIELVDPEKNQTETQFK